MILPRPNVHRPPQPAPRLRSVGLRRRSPGRAAAPGAPGPESPGHASGERRRGEKREPRLAADLPWLAPEAPDGSGTYGVAYVDIPTPVDEPRAAMHRMEALPRALKGRLLSKSDVSVEGHCGREFKVQRQNGITTLRVFIVGQRLYQLIVTSPAEAVGAEGRARFMGSFKLLPHG